MKQRDTILLLVAGLLVLALTVGVFVKEDTSEWRTYQQQFIQLVTEKLGAEVAASVEPGPRQIWSPELGVIDRCQTCHLGSEIPGLEDARQPFATHPDLSLFKKTHPFKDYGCTTCHDGQGYATRAADAHGEVHHWLNPMYTARLAADYGLDSSRPLIEMNCNQCHRRDRETEGMPTINLARKLVAEKKCVVCHIIEGRGLTVGPELTWEGSKYPEGFAFDTVEGKQSVLNWHIQHFKDPQRVSKDSLMINFQFSEQEAQALALLMMSWKKKNIPQAYLPDPYRAEATRPPTPEPARPPGQELDGKTLYQIKLCIICHGDGGRSTTDAYPSLAGQTLLYLINQMKDIKTGVRKSGHAEMMTPLVQDLTDRDMEVISGYLHEQKIQE